MIMLLNYLILFTYFYNGLTKEITCRNEDGNPVDWFYLYKLPLHHSGQSSNDSSGLRYLYFSSDSNSWIFSKRLINQSESLPCQTLEFQLENEEAILIAYNDETPDGNVNFVDGHTKGILIADEISGIWIIHSVPKYVNTSVGYNYPKNGLHYGQSFLCISLPTKEINKIGEQLIFNEPNIYASRIPKKLKGKYPNLEDALDRKWKEKAPFSNLIEFSSIGGTKFLSFAKSRKFKKELYEDLVAPFLNINLFVESWRLGPGNLPTNCTKRNQVYNIEKIGNNIFDIEFNTTSDHSKWGVGKNKSWICIGDLNRQQHQLYRGGGAVCQLNIELSKAYRDLVQNYEECA